MKYKTSELEGALLDVAVAKAEQLRPIPSEPPGFFYWGSGESGWFGASTNWALAGPIIERERIGLWAGEPPYHGTPAPAGWFAEAGEACQLKGAGPTPLIAAMRAFVASKLGEEVEL